MAITHFWNMFERHTSPNALMFFPVEVDRNGLCNSKSIQKVPQSYECVATSGCNPFPHQAVPSRHAHHKKHHKALWRTTCER